MHNFFNRLSLIVDQIDTIAWGPVTIILLLGAGLYYTIRLKGLQIRGFTHAIHLVMGKYDHPDHPGEVTHFQALSAALSATIGTGNIAGVATAIASGGPGAVFWMWTVAFLGMLLKYAESVLAQKYRVIDENGTVSGGPMYYITNGLGKKWLGVLFALFTVIASFGIGNMVQANSATAPLADIICKVSGRPEMLDSLKLIIGITFAVLTGAVIIGGIKRIGIFASAIVPFMCVFYILGSMYIIISNISMVVPSLQLIFTHAFTPTSAVGGFLGATVRHTIQYGVARGLFSSEAGLGSSPIAHAAARTDQPVREGLVAMLEPFIDTIVVCTMTALVLLTTGVWTSGETSSILAVSAFQKGIPIFGEYIVALGLTFFAFSTLISWSYYGDRGTEFLLGRKSVKLYHWLYILLIPLGAVAKIKLVWNISDIFNALMAIPNLIGILLLSGTVVRMTGDYFENKNNFIETKDQKHQKTAD